MTDTTSYEERTVEDLREQLRRRELSTSGLKSELVARLEQDDLARENRTLPPSADGPATTNADDVDAAAAKAAADAEAEAAARPAGGPDGPAPVETLPKGVPASERCVAVDGCQGKAVNGKVCSYHAMWYRPDGSRR